MDQQVSVTDPEDQAPTIDHRVTLLLDKWRCGDREALDELLPMVYRQLTLMARQFMRGERSGHSFSTADLVHETYLKLFKNEHDQWHNRLHFFAVAAKAMRHVLITHAQRRNTQKRGGGEFEWVPLAFQTPGSPPAEVLSELDEALTRLARRDKQAALIVELHHFCGLTLRETAEALKISTATVKRRLQFLQALLAKYLQGS